MPIIGLFKDIPCLTAYLQIPCAKNRHDPEKNHDKKLQINANLQKNVTFSKLNVTV